VRRRVRPGKNGHSIIETAFGNQGGDADHQHALQGAEGGLQSEYLSVCGSPRDAAYTETSLRARWHRWLASKAGFAAPSGENGSRCK
jgi:hypothetical protein